MKLLFLEASSYTGILYDIVVVGSYASAICKCVHVNLLFTGLYDSYPVIFLLVLQCPQIVDTSTSFLWLRLTFHNFIVQLHFCPLGPNSRIADFILTIFCRLYLTISCILQGRSRTSDP